MALSHAFVLTDLRLELLKYKLLKYKLLKYKLLKYKLLKYKLLQYKLLKYKLLKYKLLKYKGVIRSYYMLSWIASKPSIGCFHVSNRLAQ